jgi:hypothetical protein
MRLKDGTNEAALVNSSTVWLSRDSGWGDNDGNEYNAVTLRASCGRTFFPATLHSGAVTTHFSMVM